MPISAVCAIGSAKARPWYTGTRVHLEPWSSRGRILFHSLAQQVWSVVGWSQCVPQLLMSVVRVLVVFQPLGPRCVRYRWSHRIVWFSRHRIEPASLVHLPLQILCWMPSQVAAAATKRRGPRDSLIPARVTRDCGIRGWVLGHSLSLWVMSFLVRVGAR